MDIDALIHFLTERKNQGSELAAKSMVRLQKDWSMLTQAQKKYFLEKIEQFVSYDKYSDLPHRLKYGLKPFVGGVLSLTQTKCRKKDRTKEPFVFEAYMLDAGAISSYDNYLFLLELSAQQLNKAESRTVQYIHCTIDDHWACGTIRIGSDGNPSIFHFDSNLTSMPNDMAGTAKDYLESPRIYISKLPLQNSYGSCPIFSLDSARRLATVGSNLPPSSENNLFKYFDDHSSRQQNENPSHVKELPLYLARTWQSSKAVEYFIHKMKSEEGKLGKKQESSITSLEKYMKGDIKKQNTRLEQYELGKLCCHNINFLLDMYSEKVSLEGIDAMLSMSTLYGFIDNLAIHFLNDYDSRMLYFRGLFNSPEIAIKKIIDHLQREKIIPSEMTDTTKVIVDEIHRHYGDPKNLLTFVGVVYQLGVADVTTKATLRLVCDWYKNVGSTLDEKDISITIKLFCFLEQALQTPNALNAISSFISGRKKESLNELLLYDVMILNKKNKVLRSSIIMKLVFHSIGQQVRTVELLEAIKNIEQCVKKPSLKNIVREFIDSTDDVYVSLNNVMAVSRIIEDKVDSTTTNKIKKLLSLQYSRCLNCVVALENMLDNPIFNNVDLKFFDSILIAYNNDHLYAENIATGIDSLDRVARKGSSKITTELLKNFLDEFIKHPNQCSTIVDLYSFFSRNRDDQNQIAKKYFNCHVLNEELDSRVKYSFIKKILIQHSFAEDIDIVLISIMSNKKNVDVTRFISDWLRSPFLDKDQIDFCDEQLLKCRIAFLCDLSPYNSSLEIFMQNLLGRDLKAILMDMHESHFDTNSSRESLLYQPPAQNSSHTQDDDKKTKKPSSPKH